MTREDIPLFPLSTVLFPGGPLGLRVFEQRYLEMVRDCTRDQSCFGICLILEGSETGAPALPAAVGTLARITDFHSQPDGLLGINVEGCARFRVLRTRVRDNGLVRGEVDCWPDEPVLPVPPEHGLLADILERLVEHRASVEGAHPVSPQNLLRLSVGLEDVDDLIADWEQALQS